MQKIRDFKVDFIFCKFFWVIAPDFPNGEGYGLRRSSPHPTSLGAPELDFRSSFFPSLEIKLTFKCTARFYGLAPPLVMGEIKGRD